MIEFSLVYYLVRVGLGALGGFCAILFWPRNRDAAWVFVILGTLVLYLSLVFELLVKLRLLAPGDFVVFGFNVFEIVALVLSAAPFLFFAVAFLIMLARK
jgi:hypothetical protein